MGKRRRCSSSSSSSRSSESDSDDDEDFDDAGGVKSSKLRSCSECGHYGTAWRDHAGSRLCRVCFREALRARELRQAGAIECSREHSCKDCGEFGSCWKKQSKPDRKLCSECFCNRLQVKRERLEERQRQQQREELLERRREGRREAERRETERREAERQKREAEQREAERQKREAERRKAERRRAEDAHVDDDRSFADSRFKQLYDRLKKGDRADGTVLNAVKALVFACHRETAASKSFFAALRQEVNQSEYNAAATVWKSAVTGPRDLELCSLLNGVLRDDGPDDKLMRPAVRLTRALNAFCVTDNAEVANGWPENNRTYRGTVLPRAHQAFYRVGKKYRVPMFLATSIEAQVAIDFMMRATDASEDDEHEPVVWTFELDDNERCMHVNYISTNEQEFLFAPYSAFRVKAATWQREPTRNRPHKITLEVAADNRQLDTWPEGLPLAPWS